MSRKRAVPVSGASRPRRHPVTTEPDYTADEVQFLRAVDRYKHVAGRPWPTWCEILDVLVSLGYRKVARPRPLPRFERGAAGPGRKMR